MVALEPLRPDHADALLAFERENRAYFARTVPDRGDTFFTAAGFAARLQALLDEQHARVCRFHVVLGEDGELIGRINLIDLVDGSAELGYRIGEQAAGRGVATAAVAQVCRLAATDYGLASLTAVTTLDNAASMRVLARNGFTRVENTTVGGQPGVRYERRHLGTAPDSP
ncbi:GNAT family N-acetyltransferase [Streptomyces hawaiiensis]|uniref:GNAT family N-acetyltransferase n=1 Tax=Streptomyces hawaiiensis TaxID=67305 RepID=A0A6G5RS01_9ACTN|nr:GNAT family N-acetyltransferase [Streptomyces hawaiiensis]QCD60621.1 GNAT family N-acetyltransferase [Streptomyces hawaiiensis]